jgi:PAS domain S-box-containing protein
MVKTMNEIPASLTGTNQFGQSDAIEELPVAYVEIDAHGAVTRANRITRALHSSHAGELIGKMAWELMPIEEQDMSAAAFASAVETGIDPGVSRRSIYSSEESFRVFDLHRNLIRDAAGKPTGMRVVSVDVTEAVTAQQEAEKARQWLEGVFESMPEAVIVTDTLGIIRSVNPAAEELFGWKAGELISQDFEEIFFPRSLDRQPEVGLITVLRENKRGLARMVDRELQALCVEINTAPIVDKENSITVGVVSVLRRADEGD